MMGYDLDDQGSVSCKNDLILGSFNKAVSTHQLTSNSMSISVVYLYNL